jgi:hypothetical protein
MTKGELVVRQAQKYLWVYETSRNSSVQIDRWQARWGMYREPWCGLFLDAMFSEAGVEDEGIPHPATSEICNRARARGAVWSGEGLVPPGAIWTLCGIHTALVVKDYGNGNLLTIDGNSGDRVKYNLRPRRGYNIQISIPSAVKRDVPPEYVLVTKYYIEDLEAKPYVYRVKSGKVPQWSTRDKAEAQIKKLLAANRKKWEPLKPRPVKLGKGTWAIQLGSHRIYGAYPGKTAAEAMARRDSHYKKLVSENGPHYRKFSRKFKQKVSQ